MKIGIVGSRIRDTAADKEAVLCALLAVMDAHETDTVTLVSGGCPKGADRFAEELAKQFDISIELHLPDKSKLDPRLIDKNPRAAYAIINYARNTLIAEASDILIACVASDRKGGTEDTVKKFCKMGKADKLVLC